MILANERYIGACVMLTKFIETMSRRHTANKEANKLTFPTNFSILLRIHSHNDDCSGCSAN